MIVAVASGKGGTGKTTVAASLTAVWDRPLVAVDLDVEEPNLHLFLRPELEEAEEVGLEVPVADESRCTFCRACADLCQYKAIAVLGDHLLTFPEMCHGCGGCLAVCPEGALSPGSRVLGVLEQGRCGPARFLTGRLRVGEAMSPPLMRAVKARLDRMLEAAPADAILDAPPGVSCPAMNAVLDSDVILLVTEPTPFGFYDFTLAHRAFAPLGKPLGVVVNRAGIGDDSVQGYCRKHDLPVLAEIPYSRAVAEAYARGRVVAALGPEQAGLFAGLRDSLRRLRQEAVHA
ncbi:MAG: ATP-binding protein [Thermodesulfobacteriota bacterium]